MGREKGEGIRIDRWGEWERKRKREHRQNLQKINRVSCFKGEGDTQAFHCSSQLSEANNNSRWIQQGQRMSEWEVESCRTDDEMWERRRRRGQNNPVLKPHTPDVDFYRDGAQTQTFITTTRCFKDKILFFYWFILFFILLLFLVHRQQQTETKNGIGTRSELKPAFLTYCKHRHQ